MSEAVAREARAAVPPAPAARLGAELRTARLNLGWELSDLARSLRIRQSYLEAIEAGRMADLPGITYALGFVRAYASALGLPGEQVASRFRTESGEANSRPALSFPAPVPQRGVPAGALMLLGLVVIAGAYSGWYYVSEHQRTPAETVPPIPDHLLPTAQEKPTPSPQVATILPTAAAPSPAAAPPSAAPPSGAAQAVPAAPAPMPSVQAPGHAQGQQTQDVQTSVPGPAAAPPPATTPATPAAAPEAVPVGTRIVLKATADAWVTVKPKAGGTALFSKLMHEGDIYAVPADKTDLVVTTGNAGGTEIDVDGVPIQSLGGSGLVRRNLPLDADLLKSGHLPPIAPPKPKPPADG